MRAAVVTAPGGPRSIEWSTVPEPDVRPGEILVEVAAAGVNRADILQREGHYPPPPGAPEWPGLEVSGRVVAVGDGGETGRPGDEVCPRLPARGCAERGSVADEL